MSIATQFKVSDVSAEIVGATDVKITNISAPTANTEYSLALSTSLKAIIIRARSVSILKISFVNGESGTNFLTIPPGCSLAQDGITFTGKTLYLQTSINSNTVEVVEFF